MYHCQPLPREAPTVLAAIEKYENTGADEQTTVLLQWAKNKSMGIATTSIRVATQPDEAGSTASGPAVRIQGTKGEIQVFGPIFRPEEYRVIKVGGKRGEVEVVHCPIPKDKEIQGRKGEESQGWGHGLFWEADEAARCLRDGKKESDTLSWDESILIMDTMDEARKQGDLVYPELIETPVFDARSPLNGRG